MMEGHIRAVPKGEVFELAGELIIVYNPPEDEESRQEEKPATSEEGARRLMLMRPMVERLLRQRGVRDADLGDVTQEVMLESLDWWLSQGPEPSAQQYKMARSYVAVIARYAAYHYYRSHRRREVPESDDVLALALDARHLREHGGVASAEDAVIAEEARRELVKELALDELEERTEPRNWRAFFGHEVLGVAVEQIAESEHVPAPTIYTRIRKARQDLRAFLERRRAARRPHR